MKNHSRSTALIFTVGLELKALPTICPANRPVMACQLYSRNLSTTIIKTEEIYFCCIEFLHEMQARLVELLGHLVMLSFERCT